MKKIVKIVLTGGPCGGKSTGLSSIEKEISKLGYKVVTVSETATELILDGFSLPAFNNDGKLFEKNIMLFQQLKENFYEEACKLLPDEKILLVCDRGLMDCKGFVTDREFDELLEETGIDMLERRDSYDGVFHLVSCAKGAESAYTTANNLARKESIDEARVQDDKIISCWTGHPHFRVIDNSTDFETKIKRLLREICALLGEPSPFEIERKFLIEKPDLNYLESLANCTKVNIIQTYLNSEKGDERRVRLRGANGSYIYTVTTKRSISPIKRVEFEEKISQKRYLTLLEEANTNLKQIRKDRYCLVYKNQYFEIDIYPFAKNRAIMEIELTSENDKIEIPDFIKVVREVTEEKVFSNFALAQSVPSDLN